MSSTVDPHQLMTCPYNKAHQVEHYRMQLHLVKCRKQYPNAPKATCFFKATHVVNKAEMDYHVETCEDRFLFGSWPRQLPPIPVVEPEENWEDEPEHETYVPDLSNRSHLIIKVKGAAPAERRQHPQVPPAADRVETLTISTNIITRDSATQCLASSSHGTVEFLTFINFGSD